MLLLTFKKYFNYQNKTTFNYQLKNHFIISDILYLAYILNIFKPNIEISLWAFIKGFLLSRTPTAGIRKNAILNLINIAILN